jgi:hypothetical protein
MATDGHPPTGQEPQDSEGQESQPSQVVLDTALVWREFLLSEGVQSLVTGLNTLFEHNINVKARTTSRTATSVLVWAAILTAIIVGPVTGLVAYGKLSSDAAAFLFGAIVGAAFTFLRTFFPSSGGD